MPLNVDLSGVFNGTGGPLINLTSGSKFNVSKFPDDIADTPYFVVFRSVSKTPSFSKSFRFGRGKGFNIGFNADIPTRGFALPFPSNMRTGYNAQYANDPIGVFGDLGRRLARSYQGTGGGGSMIQGLVDTIANAEIDSSYFTGAAGNLAVSGVEQGGLAAFLAGKLGGSTAAGVGLGAASGIARGALAQAGIARNPHLATIFTGTSFREHSFQYKLIAKNKKESDTLRDMIRSFKFAMAPRYMAGDHIFQYPNQFDITLAAGEYLFKIGRSVLKDFQVDYTGEGTPAFFEDSGAPYSVALSMTFQETSIVTKREVQQGR